MRRELPRIETASFLDKQKERKEFVYKIDRDLLSLIILVGEYLSINYNPSSEDVDFYKKLVDAYNNVPEEFKYISLRRTDTHDFYTSENTEKKVSRRTSKNTNINESDPYKDFL